METAAIDFWSNLGIPIQEFIDESEQNQSTFIRKIFNRFKGSPGWMNELSIAGSDDTQKRTNLREKFLGNPDLILNALACSVMAASMANLDLVKEYAKKHLTPSQVAAYPNDDHILTYLLFTSVSTPEESPLKDLYYEHVLQRTVFQPYIGDIPEPRTHDKAITEKALQKALDSFEKKKKVKKQKSKIWWMKEIGDFIFVVYRRLRLRGVPIRLLERNQFVITADTKILKIRKDFNFIEIWSKREPKRIVKCVEHLASEIADLKVSYSKQARMYSTVRVHEFLERSVAENANLVVLELEMNNFPLESNPTAILKSGNGTGINKALVELSRSNLLPDIREFTKCKILLDNKPYELSFRRVGEETGVTVNNRGLNQKTRKTILDYFDEHFR